MIAQVIPLITMPLLSRIYSIEEHGVYNLFFSIVTSLSILATLRYELAIILPKQDVDAVYVTKISILISILISLASIMLIFVFQKQILALLKHKILFKWLLFIPLSLLFNGIIQSLNYWNNRQKQYRILAKGKIVSSVVINILPIFIFLKYKYEGVLILSFVLSQILCIVYLAFSNKNLFYIWKTANEFKVLKDIFFLYKNFPLLNAPSSLIDQIASAIPMFFINKYFGLAAAASYGIAMKVVSIPSALVSYSISQVLYQELAEKRNNGASLFPTVLGIMYKLIIFGICPYAILVMFSDKMFPFFLGEQWKEAGEFAKILSVSAYLKLIISPLSITLAVVDNLKLAALWQSIYFVGSVILAIIFRNNSSVYNYLYFFTLLEVCLYIIYGYFLLKESR